MSHTAYRTEHDVLREVLRRFLVAEVESSRGMGGYGRVVCGAVATLDSLLAAHPVDDRGRCWSCRGPGWLGCRRRVCVVFRKAHYWLRQPTHRVQAHLASELGVNIPQLPDATDPDTTDVLPRIGPDVGDPPIQTLQTPAVSPPPRFPVGRPDLDHGGAGEHTDCRWPRRVPPEHPPPQSGWSLLLTGGIT